MCASLIIVRFRRRISKSSREESEVHLEFDVENLWRKESQYLTTRSIRNFICGSESVKEYPDSDFMIFLMSNEASMERRRKGQEERRKRTLHSLRSLSCQRNFLPDGLLSFGRIVSYVFVKSTSLVELLCVDEVISSIFAISFLTPIFQNFLLIGRRRTVN